MRKLRRLRAEKGLTMDALEERTGVSKRTISEIERGMRAPQVLTLAKIARALGVDIDELTEEEAPKAGSPSGRPSPETETTRAGLAEAIEKLKDLPDDQLRQIVDAGSREGMPYLPEGVSRRDASDFAVSKLRELRLPFQLVFEALPIANPDVAAEFEDWKEERRQILERVNLRRAFADEDSA